MLADYRLNETKENLRQELREFGFKKDSYTKALIYRKRVTDPKDILFIEAEVVLEGNTDLVKLHFYDNKHNRVNPPTESDEYIKGTKILEDMFELELLFMPTIGKEEF